MLVAVAIAFLSGVTRTVSRMVNAQLSVRIGAFQSTFFNYVVGLGCSAAALVLAGAEPPRGAPSDVPAWAWLGGAVGVGFVVLSNVVTPRISAFAMTVLLFVGQISAGVAIDALVLGRISWATLLGGGLILLGVVANLLVDEGRRRRGA